MATNQTQPKDSIESEFNKPITDIEAPRNWEIDDNQSTATTIVLDHVTDDYRIEVTYQTQPDEWMNTDDPKLHGANMWDVHYYCPRGRRRDGATHYFKEPQPAVDTAAEYIQTVRADSRNLAEQNREAEIVDWPDKIGRFHLVENQTDEKKATYRTQYLQSYTILGTQYSNEKFKIQWYNDTERYAFHDYKHHTLVDIDFGRKQTAINTAREILRERSEQHREIEANVVEKNRSDIPDDRIPNHLKKSDR